MRIGNINNFTPSMKGLVKTQKQIETKKLVSSLESEREYDFQYNKEKGIINISSIIPNCMDSNFWYSLNKDGVATIQSCWQCTSTKTQNEKFKKIYNDIIKETQDGTKELSQERQKEIIEQLFEKTKH